MMPKPLTLQELRSRNRQPVFVKTIHNAVEPEPIPFPDEWVLIYADKGRAESTETVYRFDSYGQTWLAYDKIPAIPVMPDNIKQALPTLNFYRNRFYNAPSGTEEYELANAINDILPLLSRLIEE